MLYQKKEDLQEYPVGTTVIIEETKAIFYLLAVSVFDENNIAHSSTEEIKRAIKYLLEFYNENGQGYKLYMPLIGTGRSRAGLDFQESYDLIINTLLDNESFIQGSINIVIRPEVYRTLELNRRQ